MLKVSPFCTDTFAQSITPLVHCSVNNVLIKSTPLFNQSFFQMVDVTDLAAVDSKFRSPPDWDLDCSVANPVGWWSRVSADSCTTFSRARWAGELSCWKVKKSPDTERMAGSNCSQQRVAYQSSVTGVSQTQETSFYPKNNFYYHSLFQFWAFVLKLDHLLVTFCLFASTQWRHGSQMKSAVSLLYR